MSQDQQQHRMPTVLTNWQTPAEKPSPGERLEMAAGEFDGEGRILIRDAARPDVFIATTRTALEEFTGPVAAGRYPREISERVPR